MQLGEAPMFHGFHELLSVPAVVSGRGSEVEMHRQPGERLQVCVRVWWNIAVTQTSERHRPGLHELMWASEATVEIRSDVRSWNPNFSKIISA